MTLYNKAAFETAHRKYLDDPKTLTDADLAQFAVVDAKFAERARAKRAGFVEQQTDDERQLMASKATRRELTHVLEDIILPILKTYRHTAERDTERIAALESRTLELEAQLAAARTVEHVDR